MTSIGFTREDRLLYKLAKGIKAIFQNVCYVS